MFSLLGSMLRWFVRFCQGILPVSPFANLTLTNVSTGLGWLNWLVPMQDIVALFDVWLTGVALWYLYKFLYKRMGGVRAALTGVNG